MDSNKEQAFLTEYALTKGVEKVVIDKTKSLNFNEWVEGVGYCNKQYIHYDHKAAKDHAAEMRVREVLKLKSKIEKLNGLKF